MTSLLKEQPNLQKKKLSLIKRIYIIIIIFIILSCIIITNIYILQVKNSKQYTILAQKNFTKLININAQRGLIFDRNNVIVSLNKIKYDLKLNLKIKTDVYKIIKRLKKIIFLTHKNISNLYKQINNNNKQKIFTIKKQLDYLELNNFYINKNLYPELFIKTYTERYYPYKNILSSILGYLIEKKKINTYFNNNNYVGVEGIEKYYENILHGKTGVKQIIHNSAGQIIDILTIKHPIKGKNIFLTIDTNLQKYVYQLVKKERVSIIISNPNNGEILCLLSTPNYNNNIFTKKLSKEQFKQILKDHNNCFINKTIQGIYPPASTIKPYIAIAALEDKIIKENSKIFDIGWWKLPNTNKKFYDWKKWGHRYLNVLKSIEESSDTFYYKIAYNMGVNRIYKWMKTFKFHKKTNIDLPHENIGILPNKKWKTLMYNIPWYKGDTISVGIGQGYWSATPIQIHNALLILINNGISINLHLLKRIEKQNIPIKKKIIQRLIKIPQKYWNIVKKGMFGVALKKNGTAYKNFIGIKYKIAVKSGTAQLFSLKNNKKYNDIIKRNKKLKDHTLMNAYLPYEQPQYAITIVLENGENKIKIGDLMRKITDYIIYSSQNYFIHEI